MSGGPGPADADAASNFTDLSFRGLQSASDLDACAALTFEAFSEIARRHAAYVDLVRSPEHTRAVIGQMASSSDCVVVAGFGPPGDGEETEPIMVCCACIVCTSNTCFGVGPVAVSLKRHRQGYGAVLMKRVLQECEERAAAVANPGARSDQLSVRLVVDCWNVGAMRLYMRSGFAIQDMIVLVRWSRLDCVPASGDMKSGYTVGLLDFDQVEACRQLCLLTSGIDRLAELETLAAKSTAESPGAWVVRCEADGKIVAYGTELSLAGHACATCLPALQTLLCTILQQMAREEVCFLVPTLYTDLVTWASTRQGARIMKTMALMSYGSYLPLCETKHLGFYLPTCDF